MEKSISDSIQLTNWKYLHSSIHLGGLAQSTANDMLMRGSTTPRSSSRHTCYTDSLLQWATQIGLSLPSTSPNPNLPYPPRSTLPHSHSNLWRWIIHTPPLHLPRTPNHHPSWPSHQPRRWSHRNHHHTNTLLRNSHQHSNSSYLPTRKRYNLVIKYDTSIMDTSVLMLYLVTFHVFID